MQLRAVGVSLARGVGSAGLARASVARVTDRLRVAVFARRALGALSGLATGLRVARIVRALLAVIAHLGLAAPACAVLADVAFGAHRAIVAAVGVVRVDAALDLVAAVRRTWILVVALGRR